MSAKAAAETAVPRQAVRVPELARRLSISRGFAFQLVTRGEIRSLRVGRAILVPVEAITEFLARSKDRE
jgi:excisionase family DNA binding protein